jgi:hypothetical protein
MFIFNENLENRILALLTTGTLVGLVILIANL